MFYIRSNTSTKKVIEENIQLEDGMKKVAGSKEDISLMYKMPNGKGIKVMVSNDPDEYNLSIEGYPTKKSKQIISTSPLLKKLYLDIKDIEMDPKFLGRIYIREKKTNKELAQIHGKANMESIIKDIIMPLSEIEKNRLELEGNKQKSNALEGTPNLKNLTEDSKPQAKSIKKSEKSGKFISYNISGILRLGSEVTLSENIIDYKEALAKYNEVKDNSCGEYKEIRLNGYQEDGTRRVRFSKTFESEVLSYDYISNFVKDLGERLKLLSILEKDAKSAMAIEDKRYNAGYHIMEVCDMNFDDPVFRENMLKMKIAADKRRDMKKSVLLLNTINSILSVPDNLLENIETCIEKIKVQTEQGIDLYKNKDVDDFVKEYDVSKEAIDLGERRKQKLTVRPLEIEGKMVVYEKHYN